MTHLTTFDSIDSEALKTLELALANNAEALGAPAYSEMPISVLAHDENGVLIGGLTGKTFWNWLYIDVLWVKAESRTKGLGSQLVKKAETIALQRGCHSSYLWTESFEAPGFYQKLGYKEFVVKDNFPMGYQRIGLMKQLTG